jgi:starch phosphorylase
MEEEDYFDLDTLTITFSRRFVPYKRPLLLFETVNRLRQIGYHKLQVIYSGKCHPNDDYCNGVMHELRRLQLELRGQVRLAVFPTRNLDSAMLMVAGSDVWLNNPEPPMEACGTSGMKAAINGCLNFSSPDGWWLEANEMDEMAGWEFGCDISGHDVFDCDAIYNGLKEVIRIYYKVPEEWAQRMKHSIALGAYFNTHRNIREYQEKMWNAT